MVHSKVANRSRQLSEKRLVGENGHGVSQIHTFLVFPLSAQLLSSCFHFLESLDSDPVRNIIQQMEDVFFGWRLVGGSLGEDLPRYSQLLVDNILLRTAHSGDFSHPEDSGDASKLTWFISLRNVTRYSQSLLLGYNKNKVQQDLACVIMLLCLC